MDGTQWTMCPGNSFVSYMYEHHDAVSCMASSPDGDNLFSGGLDVVANIR